MNGNGVSWAGMARIVAAVGVTLAMACAAWGIYAGHCAEQAEYNRRQDDELAQCARRLTIIEERERYMVTVLDEVRGDVKVLVRKERP